jgi:hypothetical protein
VLVKLPVVVVDVVATTDAVFSVAEVLVPDEVVDVAAGLAAVVDTGAVVAVPVTGAVLVGAEVLETGVVLDETVGLEVIAD